MDNNPFQLWQWTFHMVHVNKIVQNTTFTNNLYIYAPPGGRLLLFHESQIIQWESNKILYFQPIWCEIMTIRLTLYVLDDVSYWWQYDVNMHATQIGVNHQIRPLLIAGTTIKHQLSFPYPNTYYILFQ